eukprot:scaffold1261_cov155-Skeletonema_menzelii.AAC.3
MVRHYGKDKANKIAKTAKKNSQNIKDMFRRRSAEQAAPVAAAAAAAAEEANDVEHESMNEPIDDGGGGGGGDGGGDDGAGEANDGDTDGGYGEQNWAPHVLQLSNHFKDRVSQSVQMSGRGQNRHPTGKFPADLSGVLAPSDDPLSFPAFAGKKISYLEFCYPNFFIWYPEAQWPMFYENQHYRPVCKWHGTHECCVNDGWMTNPRHAYCMGKEVAIIGRKYECTIRREEGKKCHFRGIDKKVIEQSPDYVRLQWNRNGCDFSHCSGISNKTLELSVGCLIGGMSASAFQHVMLQNAKKGHLLQSALYRSWAQGQKSNLIYSSDDITQLKRQLPEYESKECQYNAPSVAYLISRQILRMESTDEDKKRRMQMIDGQHLSSDHSFKVMRFTCPRGKPFTAVFCLLNEFSQVVGWWMTTGTSLKELDEQFQMLRRRYEMHGFDGPESATTDRCCQERAMWNKFLRPSDDEPANNPHLQPDDTMEINVVAAPYKAKIARNTDMAILLVGEISEYLTAQPLDQQVIIVDGEWQIGRSKMDLLSIGLLSGRTFIFHVAQICRRGAAFPLALKMLLEDSNVRKIGNRICSDIAKLVGWGVKLEPTVELGHLAKARGLSPTKNPSVEYLCERLFPGVVIEGKDSSLPGPRLSNWGDEILTSVQLSYAETDAYVTAMLYKETMRHMDPRLEGRIPLTDANDGLVVVLYMRSFKKVAEGVIRGTPNRNKILVEIDLATDATLFCKSAMVDVVNEDDGSIEKKSIDSLCSSRNHDANLIKVRWDLSFCRRKFDLIGGDPVQLHTRTKTVLIEEDSGDEGELREARYDADDEDEENTGGHGHGNESNASESDGENDTRRRLPHNRRRRLHHYRKEKVKNDILHIFLRHQRVLSKEHGAYYSYMTALRDALFILNDEDLEECLVVLRDKRGMNDEQIRNMMTHNFKWFLLRVRRLVPPPPDLVKRYLEVFNAFKDIVCHKSGKKLFGSAAAIAQHKATLKHIRRNCLSDIPFCSYYTPLKRDRDGLRRWACHRGTSANEGLHQKLRQLVRGFSNSPRFLKAIISEYLLMWNQNIDVKTRGLSSKYYGLYDVQLLEDEIEKLSAFLDEPVHTEWVSSKSLQCTGESFGIINPTHALRQVAIDSDADDDEVDRMADAAAGDLSDDEVDVGVEALIKMPPSSRWLAKLTGRYRPAERVRSNDEWEYFKENLGRFQGGGSSEADNYSGIRWSDFAACWNNWVDTLGHSKPTVTYKSSSHLQDAYKSMKRRAVEKATLRPHAQAVRELSAAHTNRATAASYLPEFPQPEVAEVAHPFVDAMETEDQQAPYDGDSEHVRENDDAARRQKTNRRHRCRKCGQEFAHANWREYHHIETRVVNGNTLRDNTSKVWDSCTVPEEFYAPGFPCIEGRMPKRKR